MSVIDPLYLAYKEACHRHERPVVWLITTELYYQLVTECGVGVSSQMSGNAEITIFGIPARKVGSHVPSFVLVTR